MIFSDRHKWVNSLHLTRKHASMTKRAVSVVSYSVVMFFFLQSGASSSSSCSCKEWVPHFNGVHPLHVLCTGTYHEFSNTGANSKVSHKILLLTFTEVKHGIGFSVQILLSTGFILNSFCLSGSFHELPVNRIPTVWSWQSTQQPSN